MDPSNTERQVILTISAVNYWNEDDFMYIEAGNFPFVDDISQEIGINFV